MNILEVGVKRGLEQGLEQGEDLFARLTERLISDDRVADLTQAAKEKKFRNKLYQEYGFVKTGEKMYKNNCIIRNERKEEYPAPEGYYVDENEAELFDENFPNKEKLKLPGQLF